MANQQNVNGNTNNVVQAINLSPLDILVRFRDMEAKLPHIADFKLYFPTFRFYVNNDDDEAKTCSIEAENMMNYVGLIGYTPTIEFNKLENAAGNINLNSSHTVHINLDESNRYNHYSTMATMAHEICHKLLFNSNLYYTTPEMAIENEVLADLATFYVGFGQLTMSGFYSKWGNVEMRSGYLTPRTYGIAFIISCRMNGINPFQQSLPDYAKQALQEASQYVGEEFFPKLEEALLKEKFLDAGQIASRAMNDIDYLQNLLHKQRQVIQDYDKYIDELFYRNSSLYVSSPKTTPYMALAVFHLLSKKADLPKQKALIEKSKRNTSNFIKVLSAILKKEGVKLPVREKARPCCPSCNQSQKNAKDGEKAYHLICKECGTHFVFDNRRETTDDIMTEESATHEEYTTKKEYVYIGPQGLTGNVPMGKRVKLFFLEIWKAFKCLILGKNNVMR